MIAERLGDLLAERVTSGRFAIPPCPEVALKLQQLVRDQAAISQLSAVIGADAALTATLLRRANAAEFAAQQPVVALGPAISRVGTREIVTLALASSLSGRFLVDGPLVSLRLQRWRDSLLAAQLARRLAELRGVAVDEAFVGGLLADLGALVAICVLEEIIGDERTAIELDPAAWARLIALHTVPIGLTIARSWNLPPAIAAVMEARDAPPGTAIDSRSLPQLVLLAGRVAALLSTQPTVDARDLRRLPHLEAGEEEALLALIAGLAQQIERHCAPPTMHEGAPSAVSSPAPAAPLLTLDLSVALEQSQKVIPCMALELSAEGVLLTSPARYAERSLVKLRVTRPEQTEPSELWGEVMSSTAEREGYRIDVRPFGATPSLRARWSTVLAPDDPPGNADLAEEAHETLAQPSKPAARYAGQARREPPKGFFRRLFDK